METRLWLRETMKAIYAVFGNSCQQTAHFQSFSVNHICVPCERWAFSGKWVTIENIRRNFGLFAVRSQFSGIIYVYGAWMTRKPYEKLQFGKFRSRIKDRSVHRGKASFFCCFWLVNNMMMIIMTGFFRAPNFCDVAAMFYAAIVSTSFHVVFPLFVFFVHLFDLCHFILCNAIFFGSFVRSFSWLSVVLLSCHMLFFPVFLQQQKTIAQKEMVKGEYGFCFFIFSFDSNFVYCSLLANAIFRFFSLVLFSF